MTERALAQSVKTLRAGLGRTPRVEEFVTVFAQCLQPSDIADVVASVRVETQACTHAVTLGDMSHFPDLYDLSDHVFTEFSCLLSDLRGTVESTLSVDDQAKALLDRLADDLRASGALLDVPSLETLQLTPVFVARPQRRQRAQRGSVIAIPLPTAAKYGALVMLDRNSFGTAFGLLDATFDRPPEAIDASIEGLPSALYCDEEFLRSGRWRILFRDERLTERFPPDPEVFHSPIFSPDYGPFGLAETADGRIRELGEAEAREAGVLAHDFVQFPSAEQVEYLAERRLQPAGGE